ncbi:DUF3050 domain-containing protein [Candidiatus Paracoxiella cheracis]|uniref:DUF3050 domain-containing protein n=1 Tax=Candidiatus Paracoxiella cheracis TaxID=3405120 RepID=UPI003BF5FC9A
MKQNIYQVSSELNISNAKDLTERLSPLVSQIVNHRLYSSISSLSRLQIFMGEHVFAVWDFMCLLKELHRRLVSTSAPWFPPKDALSANLISSILVEEEGDITEDGRYASHFDIYLSAMEKIGADTRPMKQFLIMLMNGSSVQEAMDLLAVNPSTKNFVLTTFSFFDRPLHELAATFVYGREGITSSMFTPMLKQLESNLSQGEDKYSTVVYYFKRHISLDEGEHFPKALKMLEILVGNDPQKLKETEQAAISALEARIEFLTSIYDRFESLSVARNY